MKSSNRTTGQESGARSELPDLSHAGLLRIDDGVEVTASMVAHSDGSVTRSKAPVEDVDRNSWSPTSKTKKRTSAISSLSGTQD